jgi:calcium-dependent protein kinase
MDSRPKFILLNKIAEGTYGVVYLAIVKTNPRKKYAIKIAHSSDIRYRLSFQNEFDAFASIGKHPFIINCVEYGTSPKSLKPYIIMEFCEGKDLFEMLLERGFLNENTTARMGSQIIDALQHMHGKNIIHGDLKIENILISGDESIRLCDFGASINLNDSRNVRAKICGTPSCMSPERLNTSEISMSDDCWALGILMYTMLTGETPWGVEIDHTVSEICHLRQHPITFPDTMSAPARDLICGLLQQTPQDRFTLEQARLHDFFINK